ncbi:hypothetical protein CRV08_03185 [Halarcobacter ebronensis]|uniref:Type II secretion system protein n=1 Tax=Halarcobacter ebronensis TaxID=1462615 RepID=A0A4Q1AM80_9BACT|nr:hypothetical protein [Halarcobacter ebronensis]QKF82761.1 hypothetical protein AEBR_2293 [Halarcobacter ebronensis]RXJ69723.1 hypothetical protein CRV08_03185 [Halarcobacter ebronensis]RXK06786.1 hypothetical protein CRV07_04975 [Halarcobacter ebronensis]
MQLEVSPEVLLSQLGYTKSDSALKQAQTIMKQTKEFDKFSKHIISLNDNLKKMNAYVALSNSSEYLKIKCDENDADEILEEFHDYVNQWAEKYNVDLQKLDKKEVYYILGTK